MSGILVDSHVLLWMATSPGRLGEAARADLDRARRVVVSVATLWELTIKHHSGRLDDPAPVWDGALSQGIEALPVSAQHVKATDAVALPHKDPFDRLLVAQAQVEGLLLLTADRQILSAGLSCVRDARA